MDKKTNQDLYVGLIRHRGAIGELSKRTGMHRNSITLILKGGKGEWKNNRVIEEGAKLLHELEVRDNTQRKLVSTLLAESHKLARVQI